jgi:cytochrome c biogenesis protein CcdA
MIKLNKTYFLFSFILFILFIRIAYSTEQVVIEFLYWDPSKDSHWCPYCEPWLQAYEEFIEKNKTMQRIQGNYTGQVFVNWTEYNSAYGQEIKHFYNITLSDSIVIKDEKGNVTVIEGAFNETYIRDIINAYLGETPPPPPPPPLPLIAVLAGAFLFGFFETFSPCLIILLSFVLSYSIGETTRFKEGFLKVATFGIGFVSATILVFLGSVGLIIISSGNFQYIFTWVICALALLLGLDLLGLNFLKYLKIKIETKPIVQKLSRKYVFTYAGLVLLGFLFYFLDPCIAPIFVLMLSQFGQAILEFLPLVLLLFCLGVILPFIGIGILAGSISKLARSTYRHRSKIRAVSGLILITYALYLIVIYLVL